jgi:hypothetical protein
MRKVFKGRSKEEKEMAMSDETNSVKHAIWLKQSCLEDFTGFVPSTEAVRLLRSGGRWVV